MILNNNIDIDNINDENYHLDATWNDNDKENEKIEEKEDEKDKDKESIEEKEEKEDENLQLETLTKDSPVVKKLFKNFNESYWVRHELLSRGSKENNMAIAYLNLDLKPALSHEKLDEKFQREFLEFAKKDLDEIEYKDTTYS